MPHLELATLNAITQCITDDGGSQADETTDINDAGADDVDPTKKSPAE